MNEEFLTHESEYVVNDIQRKNTEGVFRDAVNKYSPETTMTSFCLMISSLTCLVNENLEVE